MSIIRNAWFGEWLMAKVKISMNQNSATLSLFLIQYYVSISIWFVVFVLNFHFFGRIVCELGLQIFVFSQYVLPKCIFLQFFYSIFTSKRLSIKDPALYLSGIISQYIIYKTEFQNVAGVAGSSQATFSIVWRYLQMWIRKFRVIC